MKTLKEYLKLPYAKSVVWDPEDEIFVASVPDLVGCVAHGASEGEALDALTRNMEDWIAVAIEDGERIPEPTDRNQLPSGKFVIRMARSMHKHLIDRAAIESVSLNSLATALIAQSLYSAERNSRVGDISATASPDESAAASHRVFLSKRFVRKQINHMSAIKELRGIPTGKPYLVATPSINMLRKEA